MLAWYASSPEHGGNPDLAYSPSSPHFRPNMQSPGPPYQGSLGHGMDYSERSYEAQMGSHCQSSNYPAYHQPPSPYRPHPVSPTAHSHQYPNHSNHQMHASVPYNSSHQLGPYSSSQAHYGPVSQDMYGSRHSVYNSSSSSSSSRNLQQAKPSWPESSSSSNGSSLLNSYPAPRSPMITSPPHMPPPPIRSPPHSNIAPSAVPSAPAAHSHYRQLPVSSSPSPHSPHSWPQSQIPSPGVMHSPRTTPSPLPSHARSPGHTQPFSPPPPAPSPHPHTGISATHPTSKAPSASPGPISTGASRQPICASPTNQTSASSPLQSLQKMVMLDTEAVESPVPRTGYDMSTGHPNLGVPNRSASYFSSVEQLAGSDPGSPYPTYYNLDQNRLCTPPRTSVSTPTSSTYSSAPDCASSNSNSIDSNHLASSAESTAVGLVNGEAVHPGSRDMEQEVKVFPSPNERMVNGEDQQATAYVGGCCPPDTSDSESKSIQECVVQSDENAVDRNIGLPDTLDYSMGKVFKGVRRIPKYVRGRRKSFPLERTSDMYRLPQDVGRGRALRGKSAILSMGRRNVIYGGDGAAVYGKPESVNGVPEEYGDNGLLLDQKMCSRPPRFSSPPPNWNRNFYDEDSEILKRRRLSVEEHLISTTASGLKRGPRRHRGHVVASIRQAGGMVLADQKVPINLKSPRGMRGSGRRGGGRRRIGMSNGRRSSGEGPLDFEGVGHLSGVPGTLSDGGEPVHDDKTDSWQVPNLHVGPSPSGLGTDDEHHLRDPLGATSSFPYRETPDFENPGSRSAPGMPNSAHTAAVNPDGSVPTTHAMQNPPPIEVGQMSSMVSPNRRMIPQMPLASPTAASDNSQMSPRKKRGRPFGSKNKPKLPGEKKERKPIKRKQKEPSVEAEVDQLAKSKKSKVFSGPFVHIVGSKERPLSITVVNVPPKEEEKDLKYPKQKRQIPLGNTLRKKLGVGHTSTLSPQYDAMTKDRSWVCALCHKGSHYRSLGDLFGPYFLGEEQKPSGATPASSGIPSVSSVTAETEDGESVADGRSSADIPVPSGSVVRKVRSKRKRSELVEEFFKSAMSKKCKRASLAESSEQSSKISESKKCGSTAPESVSSIERPSPSPSPLQVPPVLETVENENEAWVHEDCVVWCNGVFLVGHRVQGVEEAVREASEMVCCKCKLNGATLGCLNKGCTAQFHYICAKEKGCEIDEDNFSLYCPKHKVRQTYDIENTCLIGALVKGKVKKNQRLIKKKQILRSGLLKKLASSVKQSSST